MARTTTRFVCGNCGHEEIRWLGQCPTCKEWNSFAEIKIPGAAGQGKGAGFSRSRRDGPDSAKSVQPVALAQVSSAKGDRLAVDPEEISRILGGGLVTGSVTLIGGEPGVGKSTLLTGLALNWVRRGVRVLYVAGEESPAQIRMRSERLGFDAREGDGFHILDEVVRSSRLYDPSIPTPLVTRPGPENGPTPLISTAWGSFSRPVTILSIQYIP